MNETEFRQELKRGLCGVYFFYGEEEYLKKFYGRRAQVQTVGDDADMSPWNTYYIDGKKAKKDRADFSGLEEAVNAVPMMGEKVYIRISFDPSVYSEDEIGELLEILKKADPETSVTVVTVPFEGFDPGKKGKPSALYKRFAAVCKMVELSRMGKPELRSWMGRRLAKESLTIDPAAAERLASRCTGSMFILSGELDKLAAYAHANSKTVVDSDMVDTVSEVSEDDEAFALANAIMNGDRRSALKALHRYKFVREKPNRVLAMVSKSLCEMLRVSFLMEDGADKGEISAKLKMHEYRAGLMMNSVRGTSPGQLTATLGRCREANLALNGGVPDYIALERFICTIPVNRR